MSSRGDYKNRRAVYAMPCAMRYLLALLATLLLAIAYTDDARAKNRLAKTHYPLCSLPSLNNPGKKLLYERVHPATCANIRKKNLSVVRGTRT